jgi:hypothetical protein
MAYNVDHLTAAASVTLGAYVGKALPILLPDEEWDVSASATTLTRRWVVARSRVGAGSGVPNYAGVFPAIDEECPDHDWMKVARYRVRQNERNGKLCVVEQVCEKVSASLAPDPGDPDAPPPSVGGGGSLNPTQVPANETILQGSTSQADIRRHPLFRVSNAGWGSRSMADFWDPELGEFSFAGLDLSDAGNAAAVDDLAGLSHYLVASMTVRTRTYSLSEPGTGTFYDLLGTFAVPSGVGYSGVDERWLVLTGTREQVNGVWMLEFVYLYSEKPWPAWLQSGGAY